MNNVSLELYRTFLMLGKTKNITSAAKLLYVSQPSVSFALKTLEEQLGTTLCTRGKKGVTLTAEGQVLFDELCPAFEHIETAERKLSSLLRLDSGVVSISAGDTVCNYFLMPLITAFGEKHPAVRFEITNRTSSETAELIRWRKADIGFINLPVCGDEFLISECLRMNNVLVAGEKYAYLASRTLNLSELAGLPMIMLEKKSSQRLQTDENLKEIGVELHPILELGSIDLIISFVINNHGLAFIPKELCGRFTDGEKLTVIKTEPTLKEIALTMIELKHIPISHAAYHFKKFVLENIRPNRQSFS